VLDPLASSAPSITIVDYGLGNLGSVANMLRRLCVTSEICSDPARISKASALILPGVGHYDHGMRELARRGLVDALNERVVRDNTPVLGICLGAQLLARKSEEGELPGLGWIAADVKKFRFDGGRSLPIPHMGWNEIVPNDREFFAGHEPGETRFYFVHSFHIVCDDPSVVAARSSYGAPFTAAVRDAHIWGVQFHPEKSHRHGMAVLGNWLRFVSEVRHAA
jgi:glutamine amidotransferase